MISRCARFYLLGEIDVQVIVVEEQILLEPVICAYRESRVYVPELTLQPLIGSANDPSVYCPRIKFSSELANRLALARGGDGKEFAVLTLALQELARTNRGDAHGAT